MQGAENEVLTTLFNKLDLVLGGLLALIAKFGWDKAKKNGAKDISGDAVDLTSPVTVRDSVMIWLTDRLHKLRGELDVPIGRNTAAIEELKIKYSYLEREAKEQKAEIADKVTRLHQHIDERSDKLERKIDGLIQRLLDKA